MDGPHQSAIGRRLFAVLEDRLRDEPVIALHGPRAVGKSTMLRTLAEARGVEVIDLDDLGTRDAVRADPATFVSGRPPVCIDEYQQAPVVLDAIKASLNRSLRPGAYLLTGSTRYGALPLAAQSLTGRLHVLHVLPMSQGELMGERENLIEALFSTPEAVTRASNSKESREDYIQRIVVGGFPLAHARRSEAARHRWFDDYLQLVLDRDVIDISRIRQRALLPRVLERVASQTAQVLNVAKLAESLGIDRKLAEHYLQLLEVVFLVRRLPAWGTSLRARAAQSPKIHVLDSGIAARLLRLTEAKLSALTPAALTQFGHLIESFTVGEIIKQVSWMDGIAGCGHWRTHDGDEVDLVIERDDGAILAFEVKASTRVPSEDFRHLRKLRDALGSQFKGGVVLYSGERSYMFEEGLYVLPISRLWTPVVFEKQRVPKRAASRKGKRAGGATS